MNDILNERWIEILKILLSNTQPIIISDMEERLKVSNRTIRNDLDKIDEIIQKKGYGKIVRKPRVGIWIEVDEEKEKEFRNSIKMTNSYTQPFSPEERQEYILNKLLKVQAPITMEELSKELYVSRITVFKDLDEVEKYVKSYNLSILRKQNYGVELVGNERDFRRLAGDFFQGSSIHDLNRDCAKYMSMFTKENLYTIEQIVKESEIEMEFKLADESISNLIFHSAMLVERVKQNKTVRFKEENFSDIKLQKEYSVAKSIVYKLEKEFDISIPEDEISYIAIHILGSKLQQSYNFCENLNVLENVDLNIVNLSKEIIELIGNILSTDLTKDKKLLIGLVLHLKPTINRLKYDLTIKNPLIDEIKENYPSIFGASWASSVLFEKYYGFKVNEDEIGYIAIHIGAAIERQKTNTKAIVVCNSGVGTSQLVSIRLEKALPNLEILDIISKHEIENINIKKFDIVISTIPIDYHLKPVVQISPFVGEKDILEIRKWIVNIENTKKLDLDLVEDNSKLLFKQDLIFSNLELKTKESVIEFLSYHMEKQDYVEKNFMNEVFEREKITSTAIGNGVAIPHANQSYVKKPIIAFATLEEPINWSGNKVDIVFLLALKIDSNDATRKTFSEFYRLLDNEEVLNKIRESNKDEEIYTLLTEGRE